MAREYLYYILDLLPTTESVAKTCPWGGDTRKSKDHCERRDEQVDYRGRAEVAKRHFSDAFGMMTTKSYKGSSVRKWGSQITGGFRPVARSVSQTKVDSVQFSAVVPQRVARDEYAEINIVAYEEEYRAIVDELLSSANAEAKEVPGSVQALVENTRVRIVLSSSDCGIPPLEKTQNWQGRYLTYPFMVKIPSRYKAKQIAFTVSVYFDDVPATWLEFVVDCRSGKEQRPKIKRKDIRY